MHVLMMENRHKNNNENITDIIRRINTITHISTEYLGHIQSKHI